MLFRATIGHLQGGTGRRWFLLGRFRKVFIEPDGSPVRPDWISGRFDSLVGKYSATRREHTEGKTTEQIARANWVSEAAVEVALGEPLHTHLLSRSPAARPPFAAGVAVKVVSEALGHSKSSYTSVICEVHRAVAEAATGGGPAEPRQAPQEANEERRGLRRPRTQPQPG
jgi:hypothetical protein